MNKNTEQHDDGELRHHSYDGIQEYDKKLPNWWLFTLYGAIIYAAGYWAYYQWTDHMLPGYTRVEQRLVEFQKNALNSGAAPTDIQLWTMSTDPAVDSAGEKIFTSNCVVCHGPDLKGKIGPNLTDSTWIHGGKPTDLYIGTGHIHFKSENIFLLIQYFCDLYVFFIGVTKKVDDYFHF